MPRESRRLRAHVVLSLAVAALLSPSAALVASACPAPLLSWYIARSDAVVVARVVGEDTSAARTARNLGPAEQQAGATPGLEASVDPDMAHRTVLSAIPVRVLKGEWDVAQPIELVQYAYEEEQRARPDPIGRVCLVFMVRDSEGNAGVLSCRELASYELEQSYAAVVASWLAIAEQGGGDAALAARLDWAIACFEEPAVREDAVRELVSQLGTADEQEVLDALSGAQRARLFETLESLGDDELYLGIELASLLAPLNDDRVAAFARRAVRDAGGDRLFVAVSAMELFAELYDWRTGRALAALARDSDDESELRQIIARFDALAGERREDAALIQVVETPVHDDEPGEPADVAEADS
jgi:hypothetical protein